MNYLKIIFFMLLLSLFSTAKGQSQQFYDNLNNLIKVNVDILQSDPNYMNKSFMFFFGISVDKRGLVDTVVYNARNLNYAYDPLPKVIDLEGMASEIKRNKKDFLSHKNQFFVFIIYLRNGSDNIRNGNDLDFNWSNLSSEMYKFQGKKKITFLIPTKIHYPWVIIK